MNILVVDDHFPWQASLVEALQKKGHHVAGIDSAEAFDEEVQDQNLDLVILDVCLPGEDGFSLAKRIHAVQPSMGIIMLTADKRYQHLQIIAYTAHAMPDEVLLWESSGFDKVLLKPIRKDDLLALFS